MLLGLIRILYHLPYRQLEGFIRALAKYVEGLQAPDYTTICRRINKLNINLEETLLKSTNSISLAVDSSGIKVHNGLDKKGVEGEEGLFKKYTPPSTPRQSRSYPCASHPRKFMMVRC
jgi:hypothetical protein